MKKSHKIFHAFSKSIYMTMQPLDIHQTDECMRNFRQKLGLFGLQSYANITKLKYFMS